MVPAATEGVMPQRGRQLTVALAWRQLTCKGVLAAVDQPHVSPPGSSRRTRAARFQCEAPLSQLQNRGVQVAAEGHHDPVHSALEPHQGAPDGGCRGASLPEVIPGFSQPGLHIHLGQDRCLRPKGIWALRCCWYVLVSTPLHSWFLLCFYIFRALF